MTGARLGMRDETKIAKTPRKCETDAIVPLSRANNAGAFSRPDDLLPASSSSQNLVSAIF